MPPLTTLPDPQVGADPEGLCLGLDLGTSGVRAVALTADGRLRAQSRVALPPPQRDGPRVRQDPTRWWVAVQEAMASLLASLHASERAKVRAMAVDGTSGTWLFTDAQGTALGEASMYDDTSAADLAAALPGRVPADTAALGPASPLARLLASRDAAPPATAFVQHQAEWIATCLTGMPGLGDEHDALKLGWDPVARAWPAWLDELGVPRSWLPEVREPGDALAVLQPCLAQAWGLPPSLRVMAGTTDGVAGFLAVIGVAGARDAIGLGVTSLGSTLVLKQLTPQRLVAPALGVYSHRLGEDGWLAGGASNSGGTALGRHFNAERIAQLSLHLQPHRPTGLDYRPLAGRGERFPVANAAMVDRSGPRPADDVRHLQGLLEGIAAVEAEGYRVLASLGAPPLRLVSSVGGGARNAPWCRLRERVLGVPVVPAEHDEPAVGAAVLAWRGLRRAQA